MKPKFFLLFAFLLSIFSWANVQAFDLSADFSVTNGNPNGTWTYGWSDTLNSALHVYPDHSIDGSGNQVWADNNHISAGAPTAVNNPSNSQHSILPAHTGFFHPGPNGEFSHFVWQAPTGGSFSISATFTPLDGGGTDVHVLQNNVSLFSAEVTTGNPKSFGVTVTLAAGDKIDFAVGVGVDGSYFNDSTGITAQILPAAPAHGGLSNTIFMVNGSSSPSANVADTVLRFAAQQSGAPAGLSVRVQATTAPNTEASWTDLVNGRSGRMSLDAASGQFVLNSTDYPLLNGVSFRVVASGSGYSDSISNVVGPFNLVSGTSHLAPTKLSIVGNSTIADLYFRATESTVQNGVSLRIQSTTTPASEASWTDLSNGNAGHMQQSTNTLYPNQFLLLVNNYSATQGVYFRAVASLSGFVDSISNASGPFTLVSDTPPAVTVQPPPGLPGSGDGHDIDHPVIVPVGNLHIGASAQTDRSITRLELLLDGLTLIGVRDGSRSIDYTTGVIGLGDHVLEARAVDDQGATGRAGTGATYLRVITPNNALRAEETPSGSNTVAEVIGKTFTAVPQGGFWTTASTWKDNNGNNGVPGRDDFAIVGGSTITFNDDVHVGSISMSGGRLVGPGNLNVHHMMTIYSGSIDDYVGLFIQAGAVCELVNSSDIHFNASPTGQRAVIFNSGICNVHGAGGVGGLGEIRNSGTLNWQTPISGPLSAASDPAAPIRMIDGVSSNSGLITGSITSLLTSDGASLLTSDGASVVSNDGGSVVGTAGGSLVSDSGGTLIGNAGGLVIGDNASSLLSQRGPGLIGSDGAGFISDNGAAGPGHSSSTKIAASVPPGFAQTGGETDLSHVIILGPAAINGGSLTGSGIIAGDVTNNSFISPGHSVGGISILGNYTQGDQGTLVMENGGAGPNQYDRLQVHGVASLGGKLDIRDVNGYTPSTLDTFSPLGFNSATGSFGSVSSNAQVTMTASGLLTSVNPSVPAPKPGQPLNIATRLNVLAGDNVLIAGFIVSGPNGSSKKVLIRGIGPSLGNFGVTGTISDPLLELHNPDNSIVVNDNWQQGDSSQIPSGFTPSDPRESAIVATLAPGNYTAVLKGAHGETGVGLAEVYDLDPASPAQLANIATRGFVNAGDDVMIGGFIVGGTEPTRILVRAIGPSLSAFGVQGALPATTLELHDANGAVISNEGWRNTQEAEILATTLPPSNDNEAAIVATLVPGNYTAVVRGKNNMAGIGLIEAYNLQ